jgi:hypothetical protein
MGRFLVFSGLFSALICPLMFGVGMTLWRFMPNCKVGSGGPASDCILFGMNIGWLMDLTVTLGFLGSFFMVPIGIILFVLGVVISAYNSRESTRYELAVYSDSGNSVSSIVDLAIVRTCKQFRSGLALTEHCPICKSLIKVVVVAKDLERKKAEIEMYCNCEKSKGLFQVDLDF